MNEVTVSKTSSEGKGIPEGAEILKKETNVKVRKIENGYIVTKNTDTKYQMEDDTNWDYSTKEYFSKTDPLEIKIKNKSLADSFED
jgi:hypothetical protein